MASTRKIKIGIVGCGTIGRQLAQAIEKEFIDRSVLQALCDIDREKAEELKASLDSKAQVLSIDELVAISDLIIEAASGQIAFDIARIALSRGKDIMVMSVGGILDRAEELFALAKEKTSRIYIPSGALAGLDAVQAASMGKINRATLITRKPPQGLVDAPYLQQNNIDLASIDEETVVFEGSAAEAVKGFPKNVNVCAALSLAGIGATETKVKIIAVPASNTNTHEIEVEGDFGRLLARTENRPTPANPKTSYLASLSAAATLRNILTAIKIGT